MVLLVLFLGMAPFNSDGRTFLQKIRQYDRSYFARDKKFPRGSAIKLRNAHRSDLLPNNEF